MLLVQHGNMLLLLRIAGERQEEGRTHACAAVEALIQLCIAHSDVNSDADCSSDASFVIAQASLGHATQI